MIEVSECRSCGSKDLMPIISLGNQYVTNFILSEEEQTNVPKVPLELIMCENCKLLQLKHNAPPESMWNEQYWYKSGISTTIKQNLKEIVEEVEETVDLEENDIVIDIGCNDGTLFENYSKKDLEKVGFEPSNNVAKEASEKGFNIINDFFNAPSFKEKFGDKKAKVITAISMFYDLEDPNQFVKDITEVLDKNGLFVIQQNYLVSMLEQNAFDNICHEHREYYSLISLKPLLDRHGLEIFDVSLNDINGGSIRTLIKFKEGILPQANPDGIKRLEEQIGKEKELGLDTPVPYQEFASRIDGIKDKLMDYLKEEQSKGKKIWIYGASTRGNVILQYFGLNPDLIDSAADKNPDKDGRKTIGSLIPITSPEKLREANPDILLVMVWHFFDEIIKQEEEWFEKGGTFVVALPEFRIVKKE
jgi:NDP-4-keto-2,6-dideoxyhexose 3-C-methyltransferase